MIEMAQTPRGLLPKDMADHLAAVDRQRKKREDRAMRARISALARAQGLDPKVVLKIDPEEALRITGENLRAQLGPEEMVRRYPCRTCSVAHDEKYRADQLALRKLPCYVEKGMRGCLSWKPKAIVA